MTPIDTAEDLLARLAPSAYWRVAEIKFTPDDGRGPWKHVVVYILGDTSEYALEGARRVWSLVDRHRRFLRVPPEADSQHDFMHDVTRHVGYVRFSFCNEPGDEIPVSGLRAGLVYSGLPRMSDSWRAP
jgi:hypothetical protein